MNYKWIQVNLPVGNDWGRPKRNPGSRLSTKVFGDGCCVVCGVMKTPKLRENGTLENPYLVQRRKTCGKDTECYHKFISGKGNGNYKGYMPTCKICGVRIGYNKAKDMKNGNIPQYCGKHWLSKMKRDKKGIYPEWLKPFAFKKGDNPLKNHHKGCQCVVHRRKQ